MPCQQISAVTADEFVTVTAKRREDKNGKGNKHAPRGVLRGFQRNCPQGLLNSPPPQSPHIQPGRSCSGPHLHVRTVIVFYFLLFHARITIGQMLPHARQLDRRDGLCVRMRRTDRTASAENLSDLSEANGAAYKSAYHHVEVHSLQRVCAAHKPTRLTSAPSRPHAA